MLTLASPGKRIPALALVGCLAGLATCGSVRLLHLLPEGLSESVGCIFGLFLCAYFWVFDETRSVWRALGFVGASTLAYLAAYNAGMPISNLGLVRFELFGLDPGEIDILLIGGFVGAGILFLALCFFFPSRQSAARILLNFVIFVVSGSVLGIIGFALGPTLGAAIWYLMRFLYLGEPSQASELQASMGTVPFYSLYVIWQAGVATLVASLFPLRSRVPDISPATLDSSRTTELGNTPLPLWKRLVAVALIFLVIFFAASEVHRLKILKAQQKQQQREIVQSDAKAPSLANLAQVEPREPGEVLILQAISGHDPGAGSVTSLPPCDLRGGQQPFLHCVSYSVSYYGLPITTSKQFGTPSFDVSVTEYPNSAWAAYSLRNYPTRSALVTQRKSIQEVSKFGNTIYLNSAWIYPDGKGTTYFYWPSGNFTVAIRFYGPTEDVVLQEYLVLHPSSL